MKFNTKAIHAGYSPDETKSNVPPIYMTSGYSLENTENAAGLFELTREGHIYSRLTNPTNDVFEQRIAALEGGVGAVAFSSGHAAMFSTIFNIACAGDEIVSSLNIYGGAVNMFGISLKRLGIDVRFVQVDDLKAWEAAITDKTKALFVETIGNPNADVADIAALSNLAKKYEIPLIVDSTFTTPAIVRPIELGADIVIHSATKYIGGHGGVMGGVVIDSGKFKFKGNKKFPLFNEPDPSYHGVVFSEAFEGSEFITRLRVLIMRDFGACMSPFNAFMLIQGLETLPLRMEKQGQNALEIAAYLEGHSAVHKVNFPGLRSNKYNSIAVDQFDGFGAIMTFELKGGREDCAKFCDALKLIRIIANVGDVRTMVIHPATTTHSQLTKEQLLACGITETTIRLSVGAEDIEDIKADIEQALAVAY